MALVAYTITFFFFFLPEHSQSVLGTSQLISWSPQYRFTQMWRFYSSVFSLFNICLTKYLPNFTLICGHDAFQ